MTYLSRKDLLAANLRMSQQIADMLAANGTEKDFIIRALNEELVDKDSTIRELSVRLAQQQKVIDSRLRRPDVESIHSWLQQLPPPRLWTEHRIDPYAIQGASETDRRWGQLRNRLAKEFRRRLGEGTFSEVAA